MFVDDINFQTGEIIIGRNTMPIIQASPEVRGLNVDELWEELKDIEAGQSPIRPGQGMIYPDIQQNFPPYTISGFTYAQGILIIPPYFITFEDGQYAVALRNANNNIIDVATENQVRILSQNSGGLIFGRLTAEDVQQLFSYVLENGETFEDQTRLIRAAAAGRIAQTPAGTYVILSADGTIERIRGQRGANNGREIDAVDGT